MTAAHLVVRDLRKEYPTPGDPLVVIGGVSFELKRGDALAIMGPSGSGKSTLLYMLGTLETPTAGSLSVGSLDPFALDETDLAAFRNEQVGFIFQEQHLLPQCTAFENVLIPTMAPSSVQSPAESKQRALKLLDRVRIFLRRAGTVIFVVAVIVWALAYFPRSDAVEADRLAARAQAAVTLEGGELETAFESIDNEAAAAHLAQSWLGRAGQWVEPAFAPLGWDWRVSAAVIAGFPAREVVVAVLGTIYAVGGEADEASLAERLTAATWPDGRAVFTLPMVLGLLVFYAWCLQCAATLAVIRRETNSWRWPVFAWAYMTALGYTAALLIYQIGSA